MAIIPPPPLTVSPSLSPPSIRATLVVVLVGSEGDWRVETAGFLGEILWELHPWLVGQVWAAL